MEDTASVLISSQRGVRGDAVGGATAGRCCLVRRHDGGSLALRAAAAAALRLRRRRQELGHLPLELRRLALFQLPYVRILFSLQELRRESITAGELNDDQPVRTHTRCVLYICCQIKHWQPKEASISDQN